MTEEQIERWVQRQFDVLDAIFMATGSAMTQAEYDDLSANIARKADREYEFLSHSAEG